MQRTNTWFCAIALLLFASISNAFAQGEIRGTVKDKNGKTAVGGAVISLQGTRFGATSTPTGLFSIKNVPAGTYKIAATYIGYARFEADVTVSDGAAANVDVLFAEGTIKLEDLVVVSTSRKPERITESPSTIQAIRGVDLINLPIIAQALTNARGIDIVRTGVDGIGFNARGFNSAFNTKILAMTDGRFSMLPGNGLPVGSFNTNIKEDIEQIELILGPSSALYGPNAHNGILNTISKDPRTSQGTTLAINGGSQNFLSGRFRHAGVIGNFAFKTSFEYNVAKEFEFRDSVYGIAAAGAQPAGTGRVAEFTNFTPTFDIRHIRFEATALYGLGEGTDIVASYGRSNNWGLGPTNAGRNYINDWLFQYAQLKFVSPRFFAQAYYTWNNSGKTFPVQNVTQLMNRTPIFGPTYNPVLSKVLAGTITEAEAIDAAKFVEKSGRWNAEAQWNDKILGFDVVLGANYQLDVPVSEGTYLSDVEVGGARRTITPIMQIGGAFQIERDIVDALKVVVAGRVDRHDNFGVFFAPKAALVYKGLGGSFRATYGRGVNTPTVLNQEIFIPAGALTLPNNGTFVPVIPGGAATTLVPINIRGNSRGFVNAAGTTIADPLRPEIVDTWEIGYKGTPFDRLYLDINGYYGISQDFISPAISLGFLPTGVLNGAPLPQFAAAATPYESVLTYVNYGRVNAFGVDVGINYFLTDNITVGLNYSWFNSDLDTTRRDANGRLVWDATRDGYVSPAEISLNTPNHKGSLTVNATKLFDGKFFASLGVRFVSQYTFISGVHYAGPALVGQQLGNRAIYGRNPTLPVQPVATLPNFNPALSSFRVNNGPLGGFTTVDLTIGYNILDNLTISVAASNLFDVEQREMVASPAIRRLIIGEVRYTIPAFY